MIRKPLSVMFVFILVASLFGISTTVFALSNADRPAQQSSLPQVTFLGEGPQTFTIEPPLKFFIKTYQNGQFLFVAQDGPTYTAKRSERVWTIDNVPAENIRLFDEEHSYGNVEAGCVVNYVQIEDNIDTRRNTFYINGNPLQVVEQGMVTYGTFTVPESGELTFFAEDSIGMIIELCQTSQTVVPGESPTPTATVTVSPTETPPFQVLTLTATGTPLTPTVSPTPSETLPAVDTPTLTPTSTSTAPGVVITLTPTNTSTAPGVIITQTSTQPAPTVTNTLVAVTNTPTTGTQLPSATAPAVQITAITATPQATAGSLPVTGGGPGPNEVALIGATLIGLFLVVGAGWWFLIRAYLQRR